MEVRCRAERSIHIQPIDSVDGPPDFYRVKPGVMVPIFRPFNEYLGCGYPGDIESLVAQCGRCVGFPDRECDLNTRNWDNLEPQSANQ